MPRLVSLAVRAALLAGFVAPGCARLNYELSNETEPNWNANVLSRGDASTGDTRRRVDSGVGGAGGADTGVAPRSDAGRSSPIEDAGSGDAGLPPLDDLGPFGPPSLITGLVSDGEAIDDPSFTDDRLLLYFNSSRIGGLGNGDIWYSVRFTTTSAWRSPNLSEVSSGDRETTPCISRDGLSLWFGSDRGGAGACANGGGLDIWVATRTTRAQTFGAPVCVEELSSPNDERAPALSKDGLSLVLTVDDGSYSQLHLATRDDPSDPFGPPLAISELGGAHNDGDGVLARELRELFFATERDSPGSTSLVVSTRAATATLFGAPVYLDELNGPGADSDPWVSSDARYIVWTSTRSGAQQLYEASR